MARVSGASATGVMVRALAGQTLAQEPQPVQSRLLTAIVKPKPLAEALPLAGMMLAPSGAVASSA